MNKLLTFFLISFSTSMMSAQVWESQSIQYPVPSFGWNMRPIGDSVVWNFGNEIDSTFDFTDEHYSIQKTTDAGKTWNTFNFPNVGLGYLSDVFALDEKTAWISYVNYATGIYVYKTDDGGNSWVDQNVPLQTWVNWVYFYDIDNGIAVGDPDANLIFEIYKTSDGGTTWTQVPAGSIPMAFDQEVGSPADYAVSGDNIWFTTDFGRVYHSKDKGLSWEVFDFNLQLSEFLWGIVVDRNNNLYITTNDITGIFRIYKRTPFASDWVEITPLNNTETVNGLCNIPSSDFLMLNSYTNFDDDNTFSTRLSLDQGKTWKEISRGDRAGFVNFSSNKVGYSSQVPKSYSEPSKVAFRYKGPIITILKDLVQNNPTIELSPNPVSDMATISWKSELNSAVNIDIVNTEGKLITSEKIAFNNNQSIVKNLVGLTKGQYLLIISDKNKILGVKEFIKK